MPLARLVTVALALAPLLARAGLVIEGKEGERTQRFTMEGQKLRMESGEHAMIFDGGAKSSIQLDPASKTYVVFTQDDLAKMKAMVPKGSGGPKKLRSTRYEKTAKTDQALGKSCDVYRVIRGDDGRGDEMCVAPYGTFGVERADFSAFRAFGEFASEMSGGEVERNWADLPGVPLVAWEQDGGQRRETFRATKVEKRSIPPSEFAPPAGWKKAPGFAEQMRLLER